MLLEDGQLSLSDSVPTAATGAMLFEGSFIDQPTGDRPLRYVVSRLVLLPWENHPTERKWDSNAICCIYSNKAEAEGFANSEHNPDQVQIINLPPSNFTALQAEYPEYQLIQIP